MNRPLLTLVLLLAASAASAAPATAQRSPGKPGAPVDISYSLLGKPVAGQPLEIELRIMAAAAFDAIRLDYGASERLSLGRGMPQTLALVAQKPGVPAVQRVQVTPQADGLHYFKVRVVTETGGRASMRGIAIPIGVGAYDPRAHLKVNGTLVDGVGGERAIVMRALED
jgi:hypothetical protein